MVFFYQNDDGDLTTDYAQLWIAYRKTGETDFTRNYYLFSGSSREIYKKQIDYNVPSRGEYEIRVTNISKPWDETRSQVTLKWEYLDEILNENLKYPYLQCTAISIKAQDKTSGLVPTFKVINNRTSIEVPNYNGSGTQIVNPSNNAFAALDMFTNNIYGAGINVNRLIATDWQNWANWCDGLVTNKKRSQINMIFDAKVDMDSAIAHIENCGRAKLVYRGTDISVLIEKPESTAALFCEGNIVPETDRLTWLRRSEKSDGVEISYIDKDQDDTQQTQFAPSTDYYNITGVPRIIRLQLWGINNADQALREATLRQQLSDSIKRTIEFQTGIEGIRIVSGDIFNYQHGGNSYVFGGRISQNENHDETYSGNNVFLDQPITLESSTYLENCILLIRNSDDTISQYTVNGPFDEETWYINVIESGSFEYLCPFIILRPNNDIYEYRTIRMERSSQQDVRIQAVQYDESVYYNAQWESGNKEI